MIEAWHSLTRNGRTGVQGDTFPPRSRNTVAHACSRPGSPSSGSGGLLEFRWDADHQTLEGAFDEVLRSAMHISKDNWKKEPTSMFARMVECQLKAGRTEQAGHLSIWHSVEAVGKLDRSV
jgi:hypothetical protein